MSRPRIALVGAWLTLGVACVSGSGAEDSSSPGAAAGSAGVDHNPFGPDVVLNDDSGGGAAGECSGDDCAAAAGAGSATLCGNGAIDDGENCDDGNSTPGDGWSSSSARRPMTFAFLPFGSRRKGAGWWSWWHTRRPRGSWT